MSFQVALKKIYQHLFLLQVHRVSAIAYQIFYNIFTQRQFPERAPLEKSLDVPSPGIYELRTKLVCYEISYIDFKLN